MDYAGVLIEQKEGKMLFQLRDNNPNIKNRNCWGLFGGGINNNEKPIDAAIRELKEELNLNINKNQLKLWMIFPGIKKKNYLFKLKLNKKIDSLKLMEGAEIGCFTLPEIRKKKNLVKSLKILLYLYPFISLFRN